MLEDVTHHEPAGLDTVADVKADDEGKKKKQEKNEETRTASGFMVLRHGRAPQRCGTPPR